MPNKSYLELATEIVTAMISKGYLRVAVQDGKDWKAKNHEAVHTIGWAILEMYREIENVPKRAKETFQQKEPPKPRLITTVR